MRAPGLLIAGAVVLAASAAVAVNAQRTDAFVGDRDDPAIAYQKGATRTAVDELNERLSRGAVTLTADRDSGYLRSVLEALRLPVESQSVVFSQGSLEGDLISPSNPRAIFFNDTVAVGWVRGSEALELAAQDPTQGVIFYTLDQRAETPPKFTRDNSCLQCHQTWDTLGVPGFMVLTTFPMQRDGEYASGYTSDHRTPLSDRWGGWFTTGKPVTLRHMGNLPTNPSDRKGSRIKATGDILASLDGLFDMRGFPARTSDVAALMTLEHQTKMANLITRVGWETRVARRVTPRVQAAIDDLVDYMLFVEEAPLLGKIEGASGFTQKFSATGPRDSKGRSLHQIDLPRRLLRYPCSYMIYSEAFGALPLSAKDAIYKEMWDVLSGAQPGAKYARMPRADREAVAEILRETVKDLPAYFQPVTR